MYASREKAILTSSGKLFIQQGYSATTMRQIADDAGVSPGLATYHFKTKRLIAVYLMKNYLCYLKKTLGGFVSREEQPLLHSACMIRLSIDFFMGSPYREFYIECLEQDIYAESIQSMGNGALRGIAKTHLLDASPDLLLLYDNYIPPSVEKILILEKEKGNFPGIVPEEIPDIVFAVSIGRYIGKDEIAETTKTARKIVKKILREIPFDIFTTGWIAEEAGNGE